MTGGFARLPLPGGRSLAGDAGPLVMGILNCTPDSFYDGGRRADAAETVEFGLRLLAEGAAILDVGGESSRPGSAPVSAEEELRRVLPVIEGLRRRTDAPLSVDTCKAEVARAALAAGADVINDITGLRHDPELAAEVVRSGAAVVLMHMQGEPRTMQAAPAYADPVAEVREFLHERAAAAEAAGVARERIIVDPGFGFGKTFAHNAALLTNLDRIVELGYPVLAGLSRKSLIGQALGLPPDERLEASLALAALAVERGAFLVRVHDVAATVRAVRMTAAVMKGSI